MNLTCKEHCKYYIQNQKANNCSLNMVGTIRDDDSICYKIQYGLNTDENKD